MVKILIDIDDLRKRGIDDGIFYLAGIKMQIQQKREQIDKLIAEVQGLETEFQEYNALIVEQRKMLEAKNDKIQENTSHN